MDDAPNSTRRFALAGLILLALLAGAAAWRAWGGWQAVYAPAPAAQAMYRGFQDAARGQGPGALD